MNTHNVSEILLDSGETGRVWQSAHNRYSWAHPDGSEGFESTYEQAVASLEEVGSLPLAGDAAPENLISSAPEMADFIRRVSTFTSSTLNHL